MIGSEHFSISEFACPCCGAVYVDPFLLPVLEKLRAAAGGVPVRITSGFRCRAHNRKVGGAAASQHLSGRAADCFIKGLTGRKMALLFMDIHGVSGIGIGPSYCHVDVRMASKRIWVYDVNGKQAVCKDRVLLKWLTK